MADPTIRERFVDLLLERVKADPYPSVMHMDMLEALLNRPDQLVEYLEALMEKVESTRFPSHDARADPADRRDAARLRPRKRSAKIAPEPANRAMLSSTQRSR